MTVAGNSGHFMMTDKSIVVDIDAEKDME